MPGHERDHLPAGLQDRHVGVHVNTVQAGRGKPMRLNPVVPEFIARLSITALLVHSGTYPVRAERLRRKEQLELADGLHTGMIST